LPRPCSFQKRRAVSQRRGGRVDRRARGGPRRRRAPTPLSGVLNRIYHRSAPLSGQIPKEVPMTSVWRSGAVRSLSLALFLAGAPLASGGSLDRGGAVREFYQVLLNTMRNGPALGQPGRFAKLAPAVRQDFDIPYMTQLAAGRLGRCSRNHSVSKSRKLSSVRAVGDPR
jgi:hypothetical protein